MVSLEHKEVTSMLLTMAADPQKAMRCLVVDDDPVIQLLMSTFLREEGYQVSTAVTGLEGIEMASLHNPQLIFMDIDMPGIDGIEASAQIRMLPLYEREFPVIIAFTSVREPGLRERSLEAGMNDFLEKPFDPELVRRVIRKWTPAVQELATRQG
jgi:CheY-like chemotaxis protein